MQVKLFYKTSSPESPLDQLTTLCSELRQFGTDSELVDADTADGTAQQELYDITQFPSIVLAGPDGNIVADWRGEIPTAADIRYRLGAA